MADGQGCKRTRLRLTSEIDILSPQPQPEGLEALRSLLYLNALLGALERYLKHFLTGHLIIFGLQ